MDKVYHVIGFDVGGTKIGIGLASSDGKLIAQARLENKDTRPQDILPQLVAIAREEVAKVGLSMSDIRAFGISSPGPADIPNGVITAPPNNKYWRNVPIRKYLEDALGIPGFFENDANCGALAEGYFGAGRNCEDYIYLTMSTGIGAGIVTGGTLVRGTGFFGGEFGHTVLERGGRLCNCGLHGCYEAYCGGRAIAQHLQKELKNKPDSAIVTAAGGKLENIDMFALEKAVRAGDEYAVQYWDEMCRRNAQAYGILINTFNPERIILGTIAWAAGDLFLEPMKKYLPEFCWKETLDGCELMFSELRRDIGYYAGVAAAMYFLDKQ